MSKSASSPTARLLQQSRLFSLPRPLPYINTARERTIGGTYTASHTATTPYPTHQALETPLSSQSSGDWGLKRSLPVRTTTKTGAPTIRVLAQDTSDHVSDFESASNHERTLAKFQEMSLPVLRSFKRKDALSLNIEQDALVSVYENELDATDPATPTMRWKSQTPWVGGIADYELDAYMNEVQRRMPEWHEFIKEWYARTALAKVKAEQAEEQGYVGPLQCLDLRARKAALLSMKDSLEYQAVCDQIPHISRELRRSEVIEDFLKRERQALEAVKYADNKAAAALQAEPDNLDLLAHIEAQKLEIGQESNAIIDGACQQVLDAIHEQDSEPLFSKDVLATISATPVASAERRAATRAFVDAFIRQSEKDARERQQSYAQWESQQIETLKPDQGVLRSVLKSLRDEHRHDQLDSRLTLLITSFLGLPGITSASDILHSKFNDKASQPLAFRSRVSASLFGASSENIPPSTHPGAGIGYLRSNANMENHPIYGPQARRSPVLSRVVRPRSSVFGNETYAKLGVGGFVTNDPKPSSGADARKHFMALDDPDQMATAMDPNPERIGGNKMWVDPTHASVDESGKIHLKVNRAEQEAIAVKTGELDTIMASKRASLSGQRHSMFSSPSPSPFDPTRPTARP